MPVDKTGVSCEWPPTSVQRVFEQQRFLCVCVSSPTKQLFLFLFCLYSSLWRHSLFISLFIFLQSYSFSPPFFFALILSFHRWISNSCHSQEPGEVSLRWQIACTVLTEKSARNILSSHLAQRCAVHVCVCVCVCVCGCVWLYRHSIIAPFWHTHTLSFSVYFLNVMVTRRRIFRCLRAVRSPRGTA